MSTKSCMGHRRTRGSSSEWSGRFTAWALQTAALLGKEIALECCARTDHTRGPQKPFRTGLPWALP